MRKIAVVWFVVMGLLAGTVQTVSAQEVDETSAPKYHVYTPEQITTMATSLHETSYPNLTVAELEDYLSDPALIEYFFGKVTMETTVTPPVDSVERGTTVSGASVPIPCRTVVKWTRGKATYGATLFSQRVALKYCWNGYRVSNISKTYLPDVTSLGAIFGWYFDGTYRSENSHYYNWSGYNSYSGYITERFGIMTRCLAKVGCIDQRFLDTGVRGHKDGSYTTIDKMT